MIKSKTFQKFDTSRVPSPCFVIDEVAVEKNLRVLQRVQRESGAKVLLALKAFSMFSLAPLFDRYLSGVCASGLFEARLGYTEFGGQVHTFCAAYKEDELPEILSISDHVVFNSFSQWHRFQTIIQDAKHQRPELQFGVRINPQHSEADVPMYDPCAEGSRLGIPKSEFAGEHLKGISGLHFHTLCEQDFEPLSRTLDVIEENFADVLKKVEWVNFGGGHHITRDDYPVDELIKRIVAFQEKHSVQVYLEPGEAAVLGAGVLVAEVLDLTYNQMELAILDTSATCHMPDILEMPYRPEIFRAAEKGQKTYSYRLGGQTCLAGDVMGDYSFEKPLQLGQRLMFDDMAHYSMVKTTTFNGIALPTIALWNSDTDQIKIIKQFGYDDFKDRLS